MPSPQTKPVVTAAILIIGNEVLSGRTPDSNIHYLAGALTALGIRLKEVRVIGDVEGEIIAAVNSLRAQYSYIFTTGGIGPTHDDITTLSIAKAFGVALVRHPDAVNLLQSHYRAEDLTEARLKMADVPQGSRLIANPISKAPGIAIENVYILAGVPAICRAMFDSIRPELKGGEKLHSWILSSSLAEGTIAERLANIQEMFPDVEIGSYPYFRRGAFGVSLVLRATEADRLTDAAAAIRTMIEAFGATPIEEKPIFD